MTYHVSIVTGGRNMDIAICVCGRVQGKCSSMGCFKAYNNLDKHFEQYKEEGATLHAYFMCQHCISGEDTYLKDMAVKLKDQGVKQVHFGKCAVGCKAGLKDENKSFFQEQGLKIIEGTH